MNRKLALSEKILLSVEKPSRYTGGEVNSVIKSRDIPIRVCMAFPDVYEVGMSHLGIQILYDMFNKMDDVWCERCYTPWVDLDKIMREQNIPLFALESQDPVKDFDFLGISINYEMAYTNVLELLDLAKIPLIAADRSEEDPIVMAGGPCTYNPEPIADFFDFFYIGEGETQYRNIMDIYRTKKEKGYDKDWFLNEIAKLDGIYVPKFYDASYDDAGILIDFKPNNNNAKPVVKREVVRDFDKVTYPTKPVIPYTKAVQDRMILEVQRGCIRGCRFCQAGMIYRPSRQKNLETLKKYAEELIENTGYDEISLSSLSTSDYDRLPELVDYLFKLAQDEHLSISLPSLRIDSFALDTMKKIGDLHKSSLTFAPEAGSQRLRNVINKGLSEEDILEGSGKAFDLGWNKVKLYFMLGHPFETEEDIKAIPILADKVARRYYEIPKDKRNGKVRITFNTAFFVPKPFTPFQWTKVPSVDEFLDKAHLVLDTLKEQLNQRSIQYQYHSADTTIMEAILARGDRQLCKVIKKAYELGCYYDAWTDYFHYDLWQQAFKECDVDMDFYLRERKMDELLPWDFIDIGVSRKFMEKEWENARNATVTSNCKQGCSGCGALGFKCGVCPTNEVIYE